MRIFYQTLALAFSVYVAPVANANPLDFTLTGQGHTYAFSLDSSPVPSTFSNGAHFTLDNINVTVDDLFGQITDIRLFNDSQGGGLQFLDIPPIDLLGDQLYAGTEALPTFRTDGPFDLIEGDANPYNLTIQRVTSTIPEPGTFVLLTTGIFTTLSSLRRRTN